MAHGHGGQPGPGTWGAGQPLLAMSHEPWSLSNEPRAMSHEPVTITNRTIDTLILMNSMIFFWKPSGCPPCSRLPPCFFSSKEWCVSGRERPKPSLLITWRSLFCLMFKLRSWKNKQKHTKTLNRLVRLPPTQEEPGLEKDFAAAESSHILGKSENNMSKSLGML